MSFLHPQECQRQRSIASLLLASNNIRDTERAEASERGRKRGGWNGGKEGRGTESVVMIRGEKKREGETVGEVFSNRTRGIFNMVSGRVDDIIIGCQDYLLVFLIHCFVPYCLVNYAVAYATMFFKTIQCFLKLEKFSVWR